MKENKAITLVSLVVTIIILIIVAGISINMTLGEEGIITIAKKAKENMELAQIEEQTKVNELYSQLEENKGIIGGNLNYDAIAKLNEFKKAIADSIEEAGGIKPEYTAETETFRERIKGIVKEVTKNATATESDISEGKTAWVNGTLIEGTKSDSPKEVMKFLYNSKRKQYEWTNNGTQMELYSSNGKKTLTYDSGPIYLYKSLDGDKGCLNTIQFTWYDYYYDSSNLGYGGSSGNLQICLYREDGTLLEKKESSFIRQVYKEENYNWNLFDYDIGDSDYVYITASGNLSISPNGYSVYGRLGWKNGIISYLSLSET